MFRCIDACIDRCLYTPRTLQKREVGGKQNFVSIARGTLDHLVALFLLLQVIVGLIPYETVPGIFQGKNPLAHYLDLYESVSSTVKF